MCLTCQRPTPHKYCSRACYYAAERREIPIGDLLTALNTLPSRSDVCHALAVSEGTLKRRMTEARILRVPGTRQYAICRNRQWAWI